MSKEGVNKSRIFYKCPDRNVSYFQHLLIYVLIFLMMLIKLLIISFNFSGMVPADVQVGTRRKNTFNTSRNLLHRWLRLKVMRQ